MKESEDQHKEYADATYASFHISTNLHHHISSSFDLIPKPVAKEICFIPPFAQCTRHERSFHNPPVDLLQLQEELLKGLIYIGKYHLKTL